MGVKNELLPLTKPVTVNTAGATAQLSDNKFTVHQLYRRTDRRHAHSISATCYRRWHVTLKTVLITDYWTSNYLCILSIPHVLDQQCDT